MSDINIKIKVDNKDSITAVDQLDKSVDNLTDSIGNLDDTVTSGFSEMDKSIESAGDSYKELKKDTDKAADSQDKLTKSSTDANKGFGVLKKGVKGVGTAFKAIGIGALVALFTGLWEALKQNQAVMDTVNTITTAIGIVFQQVASTLGDVFTKVNESTGGFDALGKVLKGVITLALTPLKLTFYGLLLGIQEASLAWEKSVFGGKDQDKITALESKITDTKNSLKETGKAAKDAAISVKDNVVEAVGEVSTLAKTAYTETSATIKSLSVETIKAQAQAITEGAKNFERLDIMLQRELLTSQTLAELQRQIRDDESQSIEDRIEANEELSEILEEQLNNEIDLIDEKINIKENELALNEGNVELQNEILQLENDRIDVNERITGQRSEQMTNLNALEKEQMEETMAQTEANAALVLELTAFTEQEKLRMEMEGNIARVENSTLSEEEKFALKMQIYNQYEEDLTTAQDAHRDEEKRKDDEANAQRVANFKDGLAIANAAFTAAFEIRNTILQRHYDDTVARHQDELDNFVGTEEEREELIKRQKTEISQIEHDQAVANKRQKLVSAAIEGGLAILASIAQLGPIAGSIVGGALVATNIGLIASQDVPPAITYARGGILNGPSHANGGILTPFGELEGDEAVINKASIANPSLRNIASAVNVAGGGEDFGTGSGNIELGAGTIAAIVAGINNKKVVLNTTELNEFNEDVQLIEDESTI